MIISNIKFYNSYKSQIPKKNSPDLNNISVLIFIYDSVNKNNYKMQLVRNVIEINKVVIITMKNLESNGK